MDHFPQPEALFGCSAPGRFRACGTEVLTIGDVFWIMHLTFPEFTRYVRGLDTELPTAILSRYPTAATLRRASTKQLASLCFDGADASEPLSRLRSLKRPKRLSDSITMSPTSCRFDTLAWTSICSADGQPSSSTRSK